MLNVPKKANDAMHLSMLEGLEDSLEALGEVILQENFTVWDPKQLIKKGRERHIFLFDMCLIFAKDSKDSNGKTKYMYKFKLMVSLCVTIDCEWGGPCGRAVKSATSLNHSIISPL